jgi:HEAT repeat protein
VPIVPSRAGRIQELLRRLASPSAADRDAAVAGLTLLGSRVLEPLGAFLVDAPSPSRLAALEVLEALGDRRALPQIVALAEGGDERVAGRAVELLGGRPDDRAASVLARLLRSGPTTARRRAAATALVRLVGAGATEGLDPLVELLLDEGATPSLRLAVLNGLADLEPPLAAPTLRPLLERLASSPTAAVSVRAGVALRAARRRAGHGGGVDAVLDRFLDPQVPETDAKALAAGLPETDAGVTTRLIAALDATTDARVVARVASLLGARGGAASIPPLLAALERLGRPRAGRGDATSARARAEIHRALASLDSRAALHDLREAIEGRARGAMPGLLEAAARIGDASVVPALARAAFEEPGLLDGCATAFGAIVRRESLRRTSASLKAVRPLHRPTLDVLWERTRRSSRSGPRP